MPSNSATSSGLLAASAVVMGGNSSPCSGRLLSLALIGDGTNACTITIYDSPSAATGLVLAKLALAAGEAYVDAHLPGDGIVANSGLYASLSGTGAACIVGYNLS